MHTETPFIASLLRELRKVDMLPASASADEYPAIPAGSETVHAVFFLLQEVGGLPLRFRFKGAVSPYSTDLQSILEEYLENRTFWGQQADRGTLSDAARAALERVAEIGRDVPDAFINSPADYERWWYVLATYVFVARSPLFATGARPEPVEALSALPGNFLRESELRAAAARLASLAA